MKFFHIVLYIVILVLLGCRSSEQTELMDAVDDDNLRQIQRALDSGASVDGVCCDGRTALTTAVIRGNEISLEILLKNGADINKMDDAGNSPLFWAAYYGRANIVKELIKRGADPCLTKNSNYFAREAAIKRGFLEIGRVLPRCESRSGGNG